MNATDYQQQAARTLNMADIALSQREKLIIVATMGLTGESGEVAELVKKGIFHQHGLDREKLFKELGDVLWYVAALCTAMNFDLGDVAAANIEKLKVRYPDGFKPSDSVARVDVIDDAYANALLRHAGECQ